MAAAAAAAAVASVLVEVAVAAMVGVVAVVEAPPGQAEPQDDSAAIGWCLWLAAPRLLFKRVLRLIYLTCDTGALSSGRVGAASVNGAGGAGSMASWSPGLSAAFGKTR